MEAKDFDPEFIFPYEPGNTKTLNFTNFESNNTGCYPDKYRIKTNDTSAGFYTRKSENI